MTNPSTARLPAPGSLMAAALAAAATGWHVFPCHAPGRRTPCSCGSRDCRSPAKHPRAARGHHDATTDAARIRAWWSRNPDSNPAVACAPSGLVVIDIDPRNGGDTAWAALVAAHGPGLEDTLTATTGGGGYHFYFQAPARITLRDGSGRLGRGIDVKANGYVLLPPSRHISGAAYAWQNGHDPARRPPSPFPAALRARLTDQRSSLPPGPLDPDPRPPAPSPDTAMGRATLDLIGALDGADAGGRNELVFRLACRLRHDDVPRTMAEEIVLIAADNCRPPLDAAEARAVVANAYRRYEPAPARRINSFSSFSSRGDPDDAPLPAVPPFPVETLPPVARRLVSEGAVALGVPPELVALPLLAFCGGVIGNTRRIELKSGYQQFPCLFVAAIAPPGSAKSPALDLARAPLDVLQKDARDRFLTETAAYEAAQAEAAESRARRTPNPQPLTPIPQIRPRLAHFYTTDSTTEAIATMLTTSPGFCLVRDELTGWVSAFDAYRSGRGGDRQAWLSLWAGSALKVDRKTDPTIYIPNPVVCVAGGIQPDMLPHLMAEAGRRDGFIERILWSYPDVAAARWTEEVVPRDTIAAVTDVFRQLRRAPLGDVVVRLDPAARATWARWYDANAAESSRSPD